MPRLQNSIGGRGLKPLHFEIESAELLNLTISGYAALSSLDMAFMASSLILWCVLSFKIQTLHQAHEFDAVSTIRVPIMIAMRFMASPLFENYQLIDGYFF